MEQKPQNFDKTTVDSVMQSGSGLPGNNPDTIEMMHYCYF